MEMYNFFYVTKSEVENNIQIFRIHYVYFNSEIVWNSRLCFVDLAVGLFKTLFINKNNDKYKKICPSF